MEFVWYENHQGQRICLSEKPYKLLDIDELYMISREYIESDGKVTGFKQKIITKTFELDILSMKGRHWKESAERMRELIDIDIEEGGKLFVGDYYISCRIHMMTPEKINLCNPYVTCKLTLVSDQPVWICPQSQTFLSTSVPSEKSNTKRYPYRYPYHYRARAGASTLYNPLSQPSPYQLIIYGPVNNPAITIGSHLYQVYTEVLENERLVIDYSSARNRIVKRYTQNGTVIDEFDKRNKQISVFELIKTGKQAVNWSGLFSFDIVLYDERSQPKWI